MSYLVLLLIGVWKCVLWLAMQLGFLCEDIKWLCFDKRK